MGFDDESLKLYCGFLSISVKNFYQNDKIYYLHKFSIKFFM